MRLAAIVVFLLACAHRDPPLPPPQNDEQREAADLEKKQREDYEEYHTTRRADCPRRCTLAATVCKDARRICEIGEANPKDEGLPTYCEVASRRCQKADDRMRYECMCWGSTGPRPE